MRLAFLALAVLLGGCLGNNAVPTVDTPKVEARIIYAPDCAIALPQPGGWAEPCVALASPNPSPSKVEIDIAANPTDPMNVIVGSKDLDPLASSCVWAVPQWSKDGGKSWHSVYLGGKKADRKPGDALYEWACVTDPILAFDAKGTAYYGVQAYDAQQKSPLPGGAGSAIYLASSKDGGETWPTIIPLHVGDGTIAYHDYMRMTTNAKTGSVYVTWNQVALVGASEVVVVASRDGGKTAAAPVYITPPARAPTPNGVVGAGQSGIVAAPDGTVYLLMGGPNSEGHVYLSTSTDDARSFSTPVDLFTVKQLRKIPNAKFRVDTHVELAIDASGGERDGCLFVAWTDGTAGEGNSDVFSRSSCDKGKTWSDPVRVNQDPTATDQIMPRIAVDAKGVVHVVYLTRAYDAANTLLDAEHAYSVDGGKTWATKRLTMTSSNGDLGIHQDGGPFFGDYIGIATAGGRTYDGFPSTATGKAEIAVAAMTRL